MKSCMLVLNLNVPLLQAAATAAHGDASSDNNNNKASTNQSFDGSKKLYFYLLRHCESLGNARTHMSTEDKRYSDSDCVLSEVGFKQSKYVAHHFKYISTSEKTAKNLIPGRIFTSPYTRTLQSVAPVAEALNIAPKLYLDLHELGGMYSGPLKNRLEESNYPQPKGLSFARMQEIVPSLDKNQQNVAGDGWWTRGRAETVAEWNERGDRIGEWMWGLVDQAQLGGCLAINENQNTRRNTHWNESAVVVQFHGGTFDRVLKYLLNMEHDYVQKLCHMEIDNGAYWLLELSLIEGVDGKTKRRVQQHFANAVYHIPQKYRTGELHPLLDQQDPDLHKLEF